MTKVLTKTDQRPIRLKGRSFLALVLAPEMPFEEWLGRLDDLASRSAGFFLGRPVVLDVEGLQVSRAELQAMIEQLAERNVRIMGIENAKPSQIGPGMPPAMRGGRPADDFAAPAEDAEPAGQASQSGEAKASPSADAPQVRATSSMIIDTPVRSGQSIIFPEGDITVVGSVASGAELVAGGSIHVYGTLRGRALAGSVGNASARIFCHKLEAELLAIDGLYKTAEDMEPKLKGKSVQLWLDGDAIRAETFN
ncbi:septum site-determining protein MinC [Pararhizobium mangrovi]|uniref:Probable septum site-determining protein MinC n=1 Tax=Pararhizobium mangrovi TaxID=2590452 RepID=A0A506U953_9HYPH|nr:septum site-determining protein MinC [Pararhizobium mangrovi]TPW29886.1 septum formation inhibitor MinC [Pararhizobium mangrovi]